MVNIRIKRTHNLGKEEAHRQVEKVAKKLQHKLDMDWRWSGDKLRFKNNSASGSIDVGPDSLEVVVRLSILLAPLKYSIEQAINEELDKNLA